MMLYSRILLGALFSGNLMALWYSIAGGTLCFISMELLKNIISEDNMWFLSIVGAVLHNIGQISVAVLVLKSTSVIAYLPFLMISGCIAGMFTGLCARMVSKRLRKSSRVS
jgi:heptaprenyl diphosphate synthase